MAYKVRCPACGKSVRLPEGDAGLAVVCLACGTKFVAPPSSQVNDDGATIVVTAAPVPVPQPAPASPAPTPAWQLPAEPEPKRFSFVWLVATVVVVLLFGGAGLTVYRISAQASGKKQLAEMLKQAESLAAKRDFDKAYQKFRELDRRATEIGVDDPDVKKIADQARGEQELVFSMRLAEAPLPPTPAPAPTPTPSPSPPPAPAPTTAPATVAAVETQPPPAVAIGSHQPSSSSQPTSPTAYATTTKPSADERAKVATSNVVSKRPKLKPIPEKLVGVSDEQIGKAIQKGVDNLFEKFDLKTGQLTQLDPSRRDEAYACGLDALCVYALLQSGQAVNDPRLNVRGQYMPLFIEGMKKLRANEGMVTYARGIRATALALYNRKEDRSALRADVLYLLMTHHEGAYTYAGQRTGGSAVHGVPGRWDNSNSQYGLLGVWSGAEVDVEVPPEYWAAVNKHWTITQQPDGTWGYVTGPGSVSMTAAGTASMFVADDYLNGNKFGLRVGREPFSPPLKKALDWWEKDGSYDLPVAAFWGYTLYGIERVGLASGFKYLGKRDWYREMARDVVARQMQDGSWGDSIDTAYALLFLARGRHPILMNKLRFDKGGATGEIVGYWGNRPRDAANLARYAGRQLERPLNWQVVGLDREWHDWLDSPILSITSHRAPYFTDADCDKFRNYAEAGGMFFLQADGDSPEFDEFAKKFAKRVFPQYELTDVLPGHAVYNVLYKVEPPPPLKAVSNGARVLLLYAPQDITRWWQARDEAGKEWSFRLGVNLLIYTAGKRELRNRLNSPYVSPVVDVRLPLGTVAVARVKYDGVWDPEPGAYRRFVNWFTRQTGTGIALDTVSMAKLAPGVAKVAHVTGTTAYQPTDAEKQAIRQFVDGGGVLLVDACGASREFADSMKTALEETFEENAFHAIDQKEPLLLAGPPGMEDVRKAKHRPFVAERAGAAGASSQGAGPSLQVLRSGEGVVIVSDMDIISGLLGTQTWGIYGYDPDYAQSLMKNLIFWTVDGKPK
jgi:hypothetical protein